MIVPMLCHNFVVAWWRPPHRRFIIIAGSCGMHNLTEESILLPAMGVGCLCVNGAIHSFEIL